MESYERTDIATIEQAHRRRHAAGARMLQLLRDPSVDRGSDEVLDAREEVKAAEYQALQLDPTESLVPSDLQQRHFIELNEKG